MMRALIVALLVITSAIAHASTRRVAVIVGNNAGNTDRAALHYAEMDAAKFAGVLGELGGVAPEDTFLLQGTSLAAVAEAFARAKERIAGFRKDPSNRVVLLFYFSGHSDGEALELGSDRLTFSELRRWLASAGADVRVALVDSCKSGALLSAKGGTPGQGFQIRLTDELASIGEALLTSSAADEVALESREIAGSFFTHHRMPIGKGTAQILLGADGIVWGFGGDGSEPATFRIVGSSGATDIPFADHGPASLIAQSYAHLLYYASAHDCAIEPLDLTTGQLDTRFRTSISCFMTIESVVQTESVALIRTSDDPGYSIRGYSKSLNTGLNLVDQADSDFVGPFPSTSEQSSGLPNVQHPAWSRTDSDGKSRIMTVPTNPWSLQPNPGTELRIIDDAVDAGAMVHGEFWGATRGNPTILFHVTEDDVRRHPVDYQPRAMFGLHNRLVVLTVDGTLLEQPIGADD